MVIKPERDSWGAARGAAAIAVICLLLRAPTFALSEMSWDETAFVLVAREILNGHWPFTTIFDHKPIGLYLHFAAALAIFGDYPIAARLLAWIVVTGTGVAVHAILIGPIGLRRELAIWVTAALLVALLGFGGDAAMSEHFANLYLCIAALFLLRRTRFTDLLAGACAGIAMSTSYLAVPVATGLLAGEYMARHRPTRGRIRDLAIFVAGAAAASAIVLAPIFLLSNPADYFGPQFAFLAGYSNNASLPERLFQFSRVTWVFIPLLVVASAITLLRSQQNQRSKPGTRALLPIVGMGVGAAVATLASGYVFPNYFLLIVPPVFVLSGALLSNTHDRSQRMWLGTAIAATALLIGFPGLIDDAVGAADLIAKTTRGDLRFDPPRQIARIARPRLSDGGTLYAVCTPPAVYQLLHIRPPTKYPVNAQLLTPQYASALGINVDEELEAIFAKRPAVIILGNADNCWNVPVSKWLKVRSRVSQHGYRAYARFKGFTFFAQPSYAERSRSGFSI